MMSADFIRPPDGLIIPQKDFILERTIPADTQKSSLSGLTMTEGSIY
jgi:hypothetical protein